LVQSHERSIMKGFSVCGVAILILGLGLSSRLSPVGYAQSVADLTDGVDETPAVRTSGLLTGGASRQTPGGGQASELLLKAGDRVQLAVLGFPELSGEQTIAADGTLQLPLAGPVQASGLSPTQVIAQITAALRPYVRRPQVGLIVLARSPLRISVTGAVVQPGPRLVAFSDPTTPQPDVPPTLSTVLGLAGGVTPNADLRNIIIRRQVPGALANRLGNTEKNELRINLWEVIQTGNLAADPPIEDGDEIVVPTAQIAQSDQQQQLISTLAPSSITVQVAGEVQAPGQVQVSSNTDVSMAVAAAGGLTPNAEKKSIILFRMTPEGQLQQQFYEFGQGSEPLRNGDLIVVGRSSQGNARNFFEFLGRVLGPFSPLFYLF
jgi:polysaccharide export outer membrane protein